MGKIEYTKMDVIYVCEELMASYIQQTKKKDRELIDFYFEAEKILISRLEKQKKEKDLSKLIRQKYTGTEEYKIKKKEINKRYYENNKEAQKNRVRNRRSIEDNRIRENELRRKRYRRNGK